MFLQLFFVLTLSCGTGGAFANPVHDLDALCSGAFAFNDWKHVNDPDAERIAKEFLSAIGRGDFIPVTCEGTGGRYELSASNPLIYPSAKYFFLGFNTEFRSALNAHLRGIIAHEVAHLAFPNVQCRGLHLRENIACELSVDREAERFAGRGVIAPTHSAVLQYIREKYRKDDLDTIILRYVLEERLHALQK